MGAMASSGRAGGGQSVGRIGSSAGASSNDPWRAHLLSPLIAPLLLSSDSGTVFARKALSAAPVSLQYGVPMVRTGSCTQRVSV